MFVTLPIITSTLLTVRMCWKIGKTKIAKNILSNSGPDHLQVSKCLPGPLQLNLYLRFRRSGPE